MENIKDNRSLLIETAHELFEKNGYDNTSISMIRARAGLSNGTYYHYFSNKEDLLVAICEKDVDLYDLNEGIEEKVLDPLPHLLTYFNSFADFWEKIGLEVTSQVYRIYNKVFCDENSLSGIKPVFRVDSVVLFIDAAQRAGTFDDSMSPVESTHYLFMLFRGILYEWTIQREASDLRLLSEKYASRILKSMIKTN